MELSPIGVELMKNGVPQVSLLRTPYAIDAMIVRLKKTAFTNEGRSALKAHDDRRVAMTNRNNGGF